jgi:predicted dehydrogenase
MIRALVIGYGSIGQRHVAVLGKLGCVVAIVSKQSIHGVTSYHDVDEAVQKFKPDYVVVANQTNLHIPTVQELSRIDYTGKVLIEKPLSCIASSWPEENFEKTYVAYNLRFHPVVVALRDQLLGDPAMTLSIRCGQHLSTWRPDRDFRETYSAHKDQGGGVLRDLSHELDYLLWFLGSWESVAAIGGNLDVLNIEADEAWSILMKSSLGVLASVNINYFDQPARRDIIATTKTRTLHADIINNTLSIDGHVTKFTIDHNHSYTAMHEAVLSDKDGDLCCVSQALEVGTFIEAIEHAAATSTWVKA